MIRVAACARFCDALRSLALRLQAHQNLRVLLIGPGTTDPIDPILSILSPSSMLIIEKDPAAVAVLSARQWQPQVSIVQGDSADLGDWTTEPYHFIIVRHPDIERFQEGWAGVFAAAKSDLHEDGLILVSAYSVSEVALLQHCFSELDMTYCIGSELTITPVDLCGSDKYLLVANKK